MNDILTKQLAIDFCCSEEEVTSNENIFTEYMPQEGRRIFNEGECYLKVASVQGKILASGRYDIIAWAREHYKDGSGAWFISQRVALKAGFYPAWAELSCKKGVLV